MTTSHDVLESRFHPTRLRPGYSVNEVDDFLDRCRATLDHYETGGTAAAVSLTKTSGTGGLLTAAEVRTVTFPTTRWREGYAMEEVDDLLDQVDSALVRWETVAR